MRVLYKAEDGSIIAKAKTITYPANIRACRKAIKSGITVLYVFDEYGRKRNLCNILEGERIRMQAKAA